MNPVPPLVAPQQYNPPQTVILPNAAPPVVMQPMTPPQPTQFPNPQPSPPAAQWQPQPQQDLTPLYGAINQLGLMMQGMQQQIAVQGHDRAMIRVAQMATVPDEDPPTRPSQLKIGPRPPQPSEPGGIPRYKDDDEEPKQTIQQVNKAYLDEGKDGLIMGFETLEMPFINGPIPRKPKREVFFELGQLGKMAARYHAVCDGGDCLALVYDTRYEDGFQYLPPDLGKETIQVVVKSAKGNKKYTCSSMGLQFRVGILDVVVLIQHKEELEDFEEEEPEDEDD